MQDQNIRKEIQRAVKPNTKSPQSGQRTVVRQQPIRRQQPIQEPEYIEEEEYVEEEVPEEPQDPVYKGDQVQIAIICETLENMLLRPDITQVLTQKELLRINQARLMLYILSGMPEMIQQPPQRQAPEESQPEMDQMPNQQKPSMGVADQISDDELIEELSRVNEGSNPGEAIDESATVDPMQMIHKTMGAIKKGEMTEVQPEDPNEGGLKGILAKIRKPKDEAKQAQPPVKQVKEEHQTTSIG